MQYNGNKVNSASQCKKRFDFSHFKSTSVGLFKVQCCIWGHLHTFILVDQDQIGFISEYIGCMKNVNIHEYSLCITVDKNIWPLGIEKNCYRILSAQLSQ